MQSDFDAFLLCQFGSLAFRPHVEADDDGVRGRRQQHVAFRDGSDAGVDDLDAHLLGRHAGQRIGQHFHRSGDVALDDQGQVFDAGGANLLRQSFQRNSGTLGELGVALLHLAVLRNALGLVAIRNHKERVAGIRHGFEPQHFDRCRRAGFLNRLPAIVEHGADFAEGVAHDVAVVEAQGSILNKNGGHGAAATIELGFDHRAHSFASRCSLGRADVRNQADHFQKLVQVNPLLG